MARVGCSPCYPERREISCCLSTSPSPGQGANATVGLKRKEELPPDCPGLLQPHQPRKAGLPEERSVARTCPVHGERAGWQQEEREARAGNANYAETGSTCSSPHPWPCTRPQAWGKAAGSCPGAGAEGGSPCPPACLGGSLLEDAWRRQGVVGGGHHRQQAEGLGCKLLQSNLDET